MFLIYPLFYLSQDCYTVAQLVGTGRWEPVNFYNALPRNRIRAPEGSMPTPRLEMAGPWISQKRDHPFRGLQSVASISELRPWSEKKCAHRLAEKQPAHLMCPCVHFATPFFTNRCFLPKQLASWTSTGAHGFRGVL